MFENIKPIDPVAQRRRRYAIIALVFCILFGGWLFYEFKNYPEERQVKHFFEALEQQQYQAAYEIWKPASSYTFKDFSQDWGPEGLYGKVDSFHLTGSTARGSGVVVRVRVNGTEEILIWVEKKDKSLSFPP